jgi:hypothetical protein
MSPEQRQAMRERFINQRPPEGGRPARPRHHMSPEERERLRDQIREADRDVYRGARDRKGPGRR